MYSIFKRLCDIKDVKVADVSKATKIKESTFSDWKAGRYTPKQDKLIRIADYFKVSLEYLSTGKDSRLSDDNAETLAYINNNEQFSNAIYQLLKLPKEKRNTIFELISFMSEVAK